MDADTRARALLTGADAAAHDARVGVLTRALADLDAQHRAEVVGLLAAIAAKDARIAELEGRLAPQARPRLGVYRDTAWPEAEITTHYYQPNERLNRDREAGRLKRGCAVNLTWTTKGTDLLARLASGEAGAVAWARDRADDLAWLADQAPDVPVYATLEHEARAKVKQGLLTGASAEPSVIGRAQGVFYRMVTDRARPNLRTTYWVVGYDRAWERECAANHGAPFDVYVFDPYANGPSDTLDTITDADIGWVKAQPFYTGQPVALGEFGMPVKFGDDAVSVFMTDVRGQLADIAAKHRVEIAFATLFDRPKDNDHQISDGEHPKAVEAFRASLND